MESKKVSFYTLGCKVNQYETNAMAQKFIDNGYKVVHQDEQADIAIVNTCTVTNMSDRKSRQLLRHIKHLNKDIVLVAVGCYVQVAKEEVEKIPEILETILNHINLEVKEKGEYTGVREMRKHICYYLKGLPGASLVRDKINHLDSKEEVEKELMDYFHII